MDERLFFFAGFRSSTITKSLRGIAGVYANDQSHDFQQ
jgi:hypothetical protein